MIKNKKLIILFCFSILLTLCCCIGNFTFNNIKNVYADISSFDSYSFTSGTQSEHSYDGGTQEFQDTNKLCKGSPIKVYYDNKETSTNNVAVYNNIKKVSVSLSKLGDWTLIGKHWFNSGELIVKIYQDGEYKTEKSTAVYEGKTSEIDMSSYIDTYKYYTISIECRYLVKWSYTFNKGSKYIKYNKDNIHCQTKAVFGSLTASVYDTNATAYCENIKPNIEYKSDNKDMFFKWNYTNYDNSLNDRVRVYGAIFNELGDKIISGFDWKKDGEAGHHLKTLNNGTYLLKLKTNLGLLTQYKLVLEPFEPLLTIESGVRRNNIYCIENESKIYWDTEKYGVKNISINGNQIDNGYIIKPGILGLTWNVEYTIKVTKITEAIDTYTIVFTNANQVDLNYNKNNLSKSVISRWYETYLKEDNKELKNSWESYSNILEFAIQREMDTVTTAEYDGHTWVAGIGMDDPLNRKQGTYYIYKQRNDQTELNAYFSKECLDSSIKQYAKDSITNNTYFSKSTPASPYQGEQIYKQLTINENVYDLFLLDSFELIQQPFVSLFINGVKQSFTAGYFNLDVAGVYKIEEINPFGDYSAYYIYIQNIAPEVQYKMRNSSLHQILTSENTRFGSELDMILFDLDNDSLLVIEKSGIGSIPKIYTYSELLSLDSKTDKFLFDTTGEFTITSINHWTAYHHITPNTYTFYVSTKQPFINDPSVNKETNELTLSYGIPLGENSTQIISVVIKKYIQSTDEWISIACDSKGTEISPESQSFVFNTQGYYFIQITDNFGRTYTRDYSFSREKPTAIVEVGNTPVELEEDDIGYYNKKVKITWYDAMTTAKMYGTSFTWLNGIMVKQTINAIQYNPGDVIILEGYYIIELLDNDFNSRRFTFFIDTTAPEIDLYSDSQILETGSFINTDIISQYKNASEYESPILTSVKKDSFPIKYPTTHTFTDEGIYEILLTDSAGNSCSKTFTIDKTAPVGQLYLDDGTEFAENGITNKKVYCSWAETGVTATVNKNPYYKGSLLSSNNSYSLVLTDKAGNSSVIVFQINSNIPIIIIKTESGKIVANNSTVEEYFTISWEDPNYQYIIQILKNGEQIDYKNYIEMSPQMLKFEESASYKFTFTNGIGVTYLYSVNANMRPSAIIVAGVDTLKPYDYTNKNVSVTISDRNAIVNVFRQDDVNYKSYKNWILDNFTFLITEDGSYKITIKNDFDLINNYYFTIKTSLPSAKILSYDTIMKNNEETLGNVKIEFDKSEVVDYKLYRNGEITYDDIDSLSAVGRYILIIFDKAGNQTTYQFNIIASDDLNWAGIITLIVLVIGFVLIIIFLIQKFKRPFKLKK